MNYTIFLRADNTIYNINAIQDQLSALKESTLSEELF